MKIYTESLRPAGYLRHAWMRHRQLSTMFLPQARQPATFRQKIGKL
jgi:hypothetical protein